PTVGGHDFTSSHTGTQGEQNGWFQFYNLSGFGQDVVAGQFLADLMVARNDPRLAEYFAPTNAPPDPPTYGGLAPDAIGQSAAGVSQLQGTRATADFRQPYVTWAENQLIQAEASFVLSG